MFAGGHDTAGSADRWDFFVSYTQVDRSWAEWIAWQLEADGFQVLLQAWDMVPGTNWAHAMQNGIRDAARTLAVLSSAYLNSLYGTQEWQAAVAADPDSARRRLIPVRIEECARPGLLGQVVSFDLFGMAEQHARSSLLTRVREVIAGRAKPAREPFFPGSSTGSGMSGVLRAAGAPAFPGAGGAPVAEASGRGSGFHALLIGIGTYEDERLPGLPWLSGMLDSAAEHLETAGYRAEIHDRSRSGAGAVKAAVHGFLSGAAPGSTLLLLLAGNVVHRAGQGKSTGRDYLVPADATVGYQPFWDLCVPVDWSEPLARTAAARVLVLVDGNTGFDDGVRGLVTDEGWGSGHIEAASGVEVAYVYRGPAAAGTAGLGAATAAGDLRDVLPRRSLTRALVEVLSARPLPSTLADLHAALERAMSPDAGAMAATSPPGRPAVLGWPGQATAMRSGGGEGPCCLLRPLSPCDPLRFHPFPALPGGKAVGAAPHVWMAAAEQHRAWERAADTPVTAALRTATGVMVERLGRAYDVAAAALADDPWHDPDLARRMARRVDFLVDKLPESTEELSAAEAALLVAGPYLHQTVWAMLIARATAAHPNSAEARAGDRTNRTDFDAFILSHPRLVRRIERAKLAGDRTSASQVGWWLTHKWCESQATSRWDSLLRELFSGLGTDEAQESLAAEVFRRERVSEMLTALRAAPTFLNQAGRISALRDLVTVAPATSEEMPLRERLVAYLLAIGQRMALELAAMPPVLVEHLGVADAVDLGEVRTALRRAEWQGAGRSSTRALAVQCRHPALQVALERHTASLDSLLAEAHRATAEIPALAGLPTHATAAGVRAAEVEGRPSYSAAGAQFRLAEDRVQELLMGEQLYENRALAVRELYQNALDACRYRRARAEYLDRSTGRPSAWTGRIEFRQGFEPDGTPYIECSDNGIGMGYRELTDVFAEAGTRTVDLPEVVEERGRWDACDPPIEFHPNSRFGVGVLSYFMIADEIRVETCRFGLDGRPGEQLRVTIAGPGNLFRIEPLGPGRESGTTVRLYLSRDPKRPSISCVGILRRILWVAEFDTYAVEGAAFEHWPAGRLAASAPVGTRDPFEGLDRRLTTQIVDAGRGVWWCNGIGAVLADGLWIGEAVSGVVLDLTGPLAPELSVDRNKIRKMVDEPAVDALLTAAIPVLRASDALEVTVDWLVAFAYCFPLVADAVVESMAVDGESWVGASGEHVPVSQTGLLATDAVLATYSLFSQPVTRTDGRFLFAFWVPDAVFFARMATWATDGGVAEDDPYGGVRSGRVGPSDLELVLALNQYNLLVPRVFRTDLGFLAGKLRTTVREVWGRSRRLGFQAPTPKEAGLVGIGEPERVVLSWSLDGKEPLSDRRWRWRDDVVRPGQVLAAASRLSMSAVEVIDRLRAQGVAVWPAVPDPVGVAPMDLVLQSWDLDGRMPWLAAGRVTGAHVLRSALYTGLNPAEVCGRLRRFGYRVAGADIWASVVPGEIDALLVSRDTTNALAATPIPTSYLNGLRSKTRGQQERDLARLRELGFPVARTLSLPGGQLENFVQHFPRVDDDHPLRTSGSPVDRSHLLLMASATKLDYPALTTLLHSESYTAAYLPDLTATRIARLAELSAVNLANICREGRCEIGNLLGLAGRTGIAVDVLLELLDEVGVVIPDLDGLGITHDDGVVLSTYFDGSANLASFLGQFVPAAQVQAASARLRREPQDVVLRLRQLGMAAADQMGLTSSPVRPSDVALLARDVDDHHAFHPEGQVSAAHVLRVSAQTGEAPTAVAARLVELGFDVGTVTSTELSAAEERTVVDLLDVTDDPLTNQGWAGLSRASILATAYRDLARDQTHTPAELATWIGGLGTGLDIYAGARFPDDLCFDDIDLLSWALNGEPPWLAADEIGLGHLLAAAGITGRSPHEIAGRFRHLGFSLAELPGRAPDDVDSVDVVLLSRLLNGRAPRLTDRHVPLAHVYHAACVLSCDVAEVHERYERLGLVVLGKPTELDRTSREHATIEFHATDTAGADADRLSPAQILAVAQFTGRDIGSICASFADLGLSPPEKSALPDLAPSAMTARDLLLLSSRLDGRGPWLGRDPAPLAHVIAAAGYLRWPPRRVAGRLEELGCAVPALPDMTLETVVDGVDRQLADLLVDAAGDYVHRSVSRAEVLAASFRFRWTPARIAARLVDLGFSVPCAPSLDGF